MIQLRRIRKVTNPGRSQLTIPEFFTQIRAKFNNQKSNHHTKGARAEQTPVVGVSPVR